MSPPEQLAKTLLKRQCCLSKLASESSDKRELEASLEIPRSTLDDIVRELEKKGLVKYREGVWEITTLGKMAIQMHSEYLGTLEDMLDADTILKDMNSDIQIDHQFIRNTTVQKCHTHVSDDGMLEILSYIEESEKAHMATPRLASGYTNKIFNVITSDGIETAEIIFPPEIHQWLSSTFPSTVDKLVNHQSINLFRLTIPYSFGIFIFDSSTAIIAPVSNQGINGLLINETTEGVKWAEKRYEYIKRDSTPVGCENT